MSPKEKHIPDNASRTSVSLSPEDRAAVYWIGQIRRARKDNRTTINDILVDSLWYFLEKAEGMKRDQIRAMVPVVLVEQRPPNKVTEMKPKNKR
jgi:hypothetical protein